RESRKSIQDKNNPYYYHYNSMAPFIAKMMRFSPSTPEKIAEKIHNVISSNNPPLRVPVTVDALIFGLIRKLLPRKIYHMFMYYSLPRIYRWGEDDHYYMDAEYVKNEDQKLLEGAKFKPKLLTVGSSKMAQ
ncbi:MAG: hypothetical protein KDD38_02915, partial [Bdellovibrionales bacterium]|nr:hypothetical protein [Bdellovibrionales bacterium]